jgi:hypothetical protein
MGPIFMRDDEPMNARDSLNGYIGSAIQGLNGAKL